MIGSIISGVIIYIALGMLYYSPVLFGNLWVELLDIKAEEPNYGVLTLVTLLTSTVLSLLLYWTGAETYLDGILTGLAVGSIVTLAYAKDFLFGLGQHSTRPLQTYCIAAGYHLIALPLIGLVMMFFY
ncbi:MAG: DUF1761 family protein [Alkalibacterium sp.]|nr:DUF1761 family protein [Alkalibacterium sp.]TVP92054.1 MAG: DUF1761 family protein [Alkalibacterium sp.]